MIEIKITNGDEVKEIAGESTVVFLENPEDQDEGMSVVVMGKGNLFKLIDNVIQHRISSQSIYRCTRASFNTCTDLFKNSYRQHP